jgi:glycosyltransferase involved in cell wall biosynthesis
MNILYLLNEFPKISESFIINEIYELEKRGHDITIISFRKNKSTVQHDEFEQLNATVWYLPAPGIDSAFNTIGKWINIGEAQRQFRTLSAKQAIGSAYIAGNIHSVIQTLECNPDHVHTHFFDWPKFALGYLQFDVPTSITAHAFGLFAEGTNNQRRALAKYVDRIVTISEYNQKYLCDTVGVQTPVDTVRMGIRPNKFEPTTQNTPGRLLTVARFVDKKGIKYAIDAVAHLVEEYPEIEYHLIGTGPRENAIRNRIHDQEIEEHVSMLNTVSDKRLIK